MFVGEPVSSAVCQQLAAFALQDHRVEEARAGDIHEADHVCEALPTQTQAPRLLRGRGRLVR